MPDTTKMEAALFEAARAVADSAQRKVILDAACGNDPELRSRIDQLLSAAEGVGHFMQRPAAELPDETIEPAEWEGPSTKIDRYKLLETIGEGGFGVVYMADQLYPIERRVALKIIKLGMDTKQVIARFEAERQALALMDHPNIARILDAGTTETGRPYFVMELVRGMPITEYCDDRKLSTSERLKLFSQVCSAVQHAHQKGIIHRDIKPSNILVTTNGDEPVPKVIDFGIAKAMQGRLTDKTLFTQFRQFIGTPVYMSPEQAQMSAVDVDTRCDIYSLGVLLYELITGGTPLEADSLVDAGYEEICRRIREEAALRPSKRLSALHEDELTTLAHERKTTAREFSSIIRGDLDWIIMKAVEKDRARRYDSCGSLSADVERYLKDEPVAAGPPSASYQVRKFVQRHRAAVLLVSAFATCLLLASLVASVGWLRAMERNEQLSVQVDETNKALSAAESARKAESEARDAAETERSRANQSGYASDMIGAYQALQLNNLGLAQKLLQAHDNGASTADLRHWEWHALSRLVKGNYVDLVADRKNGRRNHDVWTLCEGEFGSWIVSATDDELLVRDLSTRELVKRVSLDLRSMPSRLQYCVETQLLFLSASTRDKKTNIRALSLPLFRMEPWTIRIDGTVAAIRVTSDGSRLAVLSEEHQDGEQWGSMVSTYSLAATDPVLLKSWSDRRIQSNHGPIDFSPDGRWLAICHGHEIWLCDPDSLDPQQRIPQDCRYDVEFSPDGTLLACATHISQETIVLRKIPSGEAVGTLSGHTRYVRDVDWLPDGRLVSAGADHTARIWDIETLQYEKTLVGHTGEIDKIRCSKDGSLLVSEGGSKLADRNLEFCFWAIDAEETKWPITRPVIVSGWQDHSAFGCSYDSQWVATRNVAEKLPAIGSDPGSERVSVSLRSPVTLEEVAKLTSNENVAALRFSPVSDLLAMGETNGRLTVLRANEPRRKTRLQVAPGGTVRPTAFSADGRLLLLTVDEGHQTSCVIVKTSEALEDVKLVRSWVVPDACSSAAISPDGQEVATTHSSARVGRILFWDLSNESNIQKRETDSLPSGNSVTYSPNGKYLAVLGKFISLVDTTTERVLRQMSGHKNGIHSVAFSSDSRRIISGGGARQEAVKIWDVSTGQELMTLSTQTKGYSFRQVEFSPDGNAIYAASGDRSLSVWRIP